MYEPVRTTRLFAQVAQQIEQQILQGELLAGDQLPSERDLSEQFQVSRTVIREAIKALAQKGLIEIQSGRGTFVINEISLAVRNSLHLMIKLGGQGRILDLMQVREIFEPEIAALAASRMDQQLLKRMQNCIDIMDETLDPDTWTDADLDFHMALADATGNLLIPQIINAIVDLLREQRLRIGLSQGGPERGQNHHKRILKAVAKNDPEAARQAMRDHLLQVREDTEAADQSELELDTFNADELVRKHIWELHQKQREGPED
jgi:GntR family transcriptional repressor for pyruvate dehydrogenase complex